MLYKQYQNSRNAAWKVLNTHQICKLPVRISEICKADGITVRSYSQASKLIDALGLAQSTINNDGFAIRIRSRDFIFFDDSCTVGRQRFTVAHEYGHFINGDVSSAPTCRNREPSENDDAIETQANIVASRILSPACVLWALDIHSAEKICDLCDISLTAAKWRLKRLETLYAREQNFYRTRGKSCFLMHPDERAVYQRFLLYIEDLKSSGRF